METSHPKKIVSNYTINDKISKVFSTFTNLINIQSYFKDFITNIEFTKGTNTFEIDNEFTLIWLNLTKIIFKCKEVINMEFFKKLTWTITAPDYNLEFENNFCFYDNTIGNSTLFIWELSCSNEEFLSNQKVLDLFECIKKNALKRWKEFLEKSNRDKSQYESILIHSPKSHVWKVITNWKILNKIVPFLADEIEYNGNPLDLGTKMKMSSQSKNLELIMQVMKVVNDKESLEWEYELQLKESQPKMSKYDLKFTLIEINSEYTFVIFQHFYKEYIKSEILDSLGKDKKKILSELKKQMKKFR
jgi:hypothetical protein